MWLLKNARTFFQFSSLSSHLCVCQHALLKMDTGHIDNSLRDTITREVKTAVSNSQQELLSNITSLMDSRWSSFQTSIQQSQVEISQTQISKMEETLTDSYTFQRKGNENQFKHFSILGTYLLIIVHFFCNAKGKTISTTQFILINCVHLLWNSTWRFLTFSQGISNFHLPIWISYYKFCPNSIFCWPSS